MFNANQIYKIFILYIWFALYVSLQKFVKLQFITNALVIKCCSKANC
jgi:hypothetical protein